MIKLYLVIRAYLLYFKSITIGLIVYHWDYKMAREWKKQSFIWRLNIGIPYAMEYVYKHGKIYGGII